jgi:hypothetical protein
MTTTMASLSHRWNGGDHERSRSATAAALAVAAVVHKQHPMLYLLLVYTFSTEFWKLRYYSSS